MATAVTTGAAWLSEACGGDRLYGCLFLAVALVSAAWVRPSDLLGAAVAAPIAFAAGLVTTCGATGMMTELALRAPWLFAGTALAAAVALGRRTARLVSDLRRQRRARRPAATQAG